MKVPTPSVRLRPEQQPGFTATGVEPMQNPEATALRQVGAAGVDAGSAMARADTMLRIRTDRARAKEADAKIADGVREIMASPKGYLNQIGRDVIDNRQSIIDAVNAHRRSVLDTLTPDQREMVAESDDSRYQHVRTAIDEHYHKQLSAYELSTTEARADTLLRDALEGYFSQTQRNVPAEEVGAGTGHSFNAFEDNRVAALGELDEVGRRRGLPPEATALMKQKADDQLHAGVVARLLSQDRSLDAADFLSKNEKRLSPEAKTELTKAVAVGGVQEQGQQIARQLMSQNLSLLEQVNWLSDAHANKHLDIKVFDEAVRRLREFNGIKEQETRRSELDAVDAAKAWSGLNPAKDLPPELRSKLGKQGPAFDLWKLQEGNLVTTRRGRDALDLSDEELMSRYPTLDALKADLWVDMSADDMDRHLVPRWRQLHGQSLSAEDAVTLDRHAYTRSLLNRKGFYKDWERQWGDAELGRRMDAFNVAVDARINELARESGGVKKKPREQLYAQAVEDTFANGFVVGGKWLPSSMSLKEDAAQAVLVVRKPGIQGDLFTAWKAGETETVNPAEIGTVPDGKGGFTETTTKRLPTGELVDLRPTPGADKRPTRDEIIDALRTNLGRDPHEEEIGAWALRWMRDRDERNKLAAEAASLESKIRARQLLEKLNDEFTSQFSADWQKLHQSGTDSRWWMSGGPVQPARYQVKRGENIWLDPKHPERQPITNAMKEAAESALEKVLSQHESELNAYQIAPFDAAMWVSGARTVLGDSHRFFREQRLPGGELTPSDTVFPAKGQKRDPSPSAKELQRLEELRKLYAKTQAPK